MNRSRLRVLAVLSILVVALSCSDLNVMTASYATLAEARAAGAVERGEMPGGLPEGAYDIRTAHDADSPRRWGLFSFPPEGADTLRRILQAETISTDDQAIDAPPRIEWWPVLLRGELNHEKIAATGMQVYQGTDGSLVFGVNWKQGRAYYWTPMME